MPVVEILDNTTHEWAALDRNQQRHKLCGILRGGMHIYCKNIPFSDAPDWSVHLLTHTGENSELYMDGILKATEFVNKNYERIEKFAGIRISEVSIMQEGIDNLYFVAFVFDDIFDTFEEAKEVAEQIAAGIGYED
jgi:hypothetical protein